MSRSYKKTPIYKAGSSIYRQFMKRQTNKKVRKDWNTLNGTKYKRKVHSWDIYDYVIYETLQEHILWENKKIEYQIMRYGIDNISSYLIDDIYHSEWKKLYYRK